MPASKCFYVLYKNQMLYLIFHSEIILWLQRLMKTAKGLNVIFILSISSQLPFF